MSIMYRARLSQAMIELEGFPKYIFVPSVADAQDGFWIDTDYDFTREEETCVEFIMPSQIMFVEKVNSYDEDK